MKINKMALAWITSDNLEKSKDFFANTLGLKIDVETREYGWMELVAQDESFRLGVGRCDEHNPVKPGQNAILTMTVDDIAAAKKELESKSAKIIGDIVEVPGHVKMLTFEDPDGNKFQLVEELYK